MCSPGTRQDKLGSSESPNISYTTFLSRFSYSSRVGPRAKTARRRATAPGRPPCVSMRISLPPPRLARTAHRKRAWPPLDATARGFLWAASHHHRRRRRSSSSVASLRSPHRPQTVVAA
eukprot:3495818-Prymnesium_polylepis.2